MVLQVPVKSRDTDWRERSGASMGPLLNCPQSNEFFLLKTP